MRVASMRRYICRVVVMKALFPKLKRNTGCFMEDKGRKTATQRKMDRAR